MPASYAHVQTSRAGRYLSQLCSHGTMMSRLAGHRPPGPGPGPGHGNGNGARPPAAAVTVAGTEAIIDFGWGRCTLHADAGALALHAEAADPQRLRQIQDSIGARLRRIGRRDQLTVTWTAEPQGSGSQQEAGPPTAGLGGDARGAQGRRPPEEIVEHRVDRGPDGFFDVADRRVDRAAPAHRRHQSEDALIAECLRVRDAQLARHLGI